MAMSGAFAAQGVAGNGEAIRFDEGLGNELDELDDFEEPEAEPTQKKKKKKKKKIFGLKTGKAGSRGGGSSAGGGGAWTQAKGSRAERKKQEGFDQDQERKRHRSERWSHVPAPRIPLRSDKSPRPAAGGSGGRGGGGDFAGQLAFQ